MSRITVEYWPLDRLVAYARNPRRNDHAVDRMCAAITEFGFRVPILVRSSGLVVDGHLRLKAARRLGMAEVPVILVDDLSEAQIKALRLQMNRSATWAEWDDELLRIELEELQAVDYDVTLTGFDTDEIDAILAGSEAGTVEDQDAGPGGTDGEDDAPEPPAEPVSRVGDLWLLGAHRLSLCRQHRPGGGGAADGGRARRALLHQPALWQPARLHHRRHRRLGSPDAGRVRNPADDAGGTGADQPGVDPP